MTDKRLHKLIDVSDGLNKYSVCLMCYSCIKKCSVIMLNVEHFITLSGLIVLLSVFAITIPFVFVFQAVSRNFFLQNTSLNVADYHYTSTITVVYWKQVIFAIAILLFYYEFGYTFGNILRGNPISIVVVCVYVLFIPPLFAYDIANVFNNIAKEIFEFVGTFTLNKAIDVSIFNGVLELVGLFIAMILCNIIISKKRSAYV